MRSARIWWGHTGVRTAWFPQKVLRQEKTQYSRDSLLYKSHILPVLGQRRDSKKVVLLVTDGQSNRETKKTIPNAKKLKDMGVSIFVVAVGEYIDGIGEMVKVAGTKNPSAPPDDFLFRVRDYDGFLKVTKLVVNEVPKGVPLSSNC